MPSDSEMFLLNLYMAEHDDACPRCDYNLHGLTGSICPECGEPIVLGVRPAHDNFAAPITGLIGLSAGAGFCGVLLLFFIREFISFPTRAEEFIWGLGLALLVDTLLIIGWLRGWRTIAIINRVWGWLLALGCWLVPPINLTLFAYLVR